MEWVTPGGQSTDVGKGAPVSLAGIEKACKQGCGSMVHRVQVVTAIRLQKWTAPDLGIGLLKCIRILPTTKASFMALELKR